MIYRGVSRLGLVTWVRLYLLGFTSVEVAVFLLFHPVVFEGCLSAQLTPRRDVILHQFEHRDLCQVLGISHGRFVFSLLLIYLFNQSFYLHLYGLMEFYFVLWIITQFDFILVLKSS